MDALADLARRLRRLPGQNMPVGQQCAAVLLALTDTVRPEVILTLRAQHLRRHRGEVALPGGKWEPGDASLWHTALRESAEEVALEPDQVEYLGALPPLLSRYGLKVAPFVARVPDALELIPNPDELEQIFTVPLDFFAREEMLGVRVVERDGVRYRCPSFRYCGFEIWGLTALILLQLTALGSERPLQHEWSGLFRAS